MNLYGSLIKLSAAALACLFFLLVCQGIQAQEKNVLDTIHDILKRTKDVALVSKELNALGNYYLDKNEMENAEVLMNEFMKYAEKNEDQKGMYDAFGLAGSIALRHNDKAKARHYHHEWMKEAVSKDNDYGIHGATFLLIKILYTEGKMDSLISESKKVLEAPNVPYDSVFFPRFNSMLGNVYYKQGDFRSASEYYLKALSVAEKTGNEHVQSVCIGNLGIINKELKNYREALKFYRKALAIRTKNNMLHDIAGTYVGMASCYENMELNDSAVLLFTKALDLFKNLDSKPNIALVSNNLGQLLVSMNQPDSGMHYLQEAKLQFTRLNDSINLAYNAWAIGDAWWEISWWKENKAYLSHALKEMLVSKNLSEIKGLEDLKLNAYKSLSTIYDELGNRGQAFTYLKLYSDMSDSIRSKQYTSQIAEMQTKYDTEKKEAEIAKLNMVNLLSEEKIARQRVTNYSLLSIAGLILLSGTVVFRNIQKKRSVEKHVAVLEKQNAIESMRTKIASDVHDEMGANLTRLGLNAQQLLQSSAVPETEKLLAEKMSIQSKEIITGMREIIWASNPANDNLKSMLGFMRQYIDRFFDGTQIRAIVNFPHDAGEVTLHPEVRRNLLLILKESLNNALKYSDSDRIDIDFQNENEKFNLKIKDYGKGIDDKNTDDFSNGIRNMQMRAEQIQSLFNLITAPGKGVQICVEGKLY